jgi:hypothetical protein
MKCTETQSLISQYLDGVVSRRQMKLVNEHLAGCRACSAHYVMLRQTQHMVASLGRKQPPPELALRLRLALSREAANPRPHPLRGLMVQLEDSLRGFMVPATAGLLSAIVFFGLLIGYFFVPAQLQASADDVPTMLYTPPELASSPFGIGLGNINADSVVIEAYIDANGRVQDYRILSAPDEDARALRPELNNALIFTVFRPATAFGRPTPGRAVLSFAKINVKG